MNSYLVAVQHGTGFDRVSKCKETYRVHSVFDAAVNLVAESGFLTILPLRRGCGKDCVTVAVSGGFSFFALGISPGDEVRMSAPSKLRLGETTVVDFSGSRRWRSPLEAIDCVPSIRDENMTVLESAVTLNGVDPLSGEAVDSDTYRAGLGSAGVLSDIRGALLHNDEKRLETALARIIGFGPGLTPSGDDLVLGISLTRAVYGRFVQSASDIWEAGVRKNLDKTCDLSAFFIREALEGSAHEVIERALVCLLRGEPCETVDAVNKLISVGATSGCDIGLGMYLALDWQRRYDWCSKGW